MLFRVARLEDIPQIIEVRHAVKENVALNPDAVSEMDCEEYLTQRGRGWVCEVDQKVVGFSIIDVKERNIWALFIHPDFEQRGIGKRLHQLMLDWYFEQYEEPLWLGTDPGTRAEQFYQLQGWKIVGMRENGEVKMEIERSGWRVL